MNATPNASASSHEVVLKKYYLAVTCGLHYDKYFAMTRSLINVSMGVGFREKVTVFSTVCTKLKHRNALRFQQHTESVPVNEPAADKQALSEQT